jgi:pimeloyl-ACP methyl ester carboxylesterase
VKREMITLGGIEVELHETGEGAPILFLHSGQGFVPARPYVGMLAKSRRLIAPSHPGFGSSGLPDWLDTADDISYLYLELLDRLGLEKVDLVGCSLGGWIAAEMAAANPAQFSKMILVAPVGVRPPQGEIMDMFTVTARVYLTRGAADPQKPDFTKLFGGEQTPEQYEAWEEARAETARLAWAPYMFNPSLPHLLESVDGLPTMLLWGKQDPVVPLSAAEVYQRSIKGSKVVTIDNCGHYPGVEQPAEFLKQVRAFLG